MFSPEVIEKLGHYVYRLIDPRNGETFYVGKGQGNRVFSHARGEAEVESGDLSEKVHRIRQIRLSGFEVAHVVHRHGLDERQAFEVEAALIDAFPEVLNEVNGRASDERGAMHAKQIIETYRAPIAEFRHRVVLITVNRTVIERGSAYEAVRYAWKIDPKKAERAELVLALQQGLIVGVFVAEKWLKATTENFPGTLENRDGRWGFIGREAHEDIQKLYFRHRIPDELKKRGAANPVRYVG